MARALFTGRRLSQTLPGLGNFYMVGQWAGVAGVPLVAAMGRDSARFPEMPTTLVEHAEEMAGTLDLNDIILKACAPVVEERFQSAGEFVSALQSLEKQLKVESPG